MTLNPEHQKLTQSKLIQICSFVPGSLSLDVALILFSLAYAHVVAKVIC